MSRGSLGAVLATGAMFLSLALWSGTGVLAGGARTTVPIRSSSPAAPPRVHVPWSRVGRNVDVSRKSGPQSETSIAVNPTDPNNAIAGVNDLTSTAQFWETNDGGRTWALAGLNLNPDFC